MPSIEITPTSTTGLVAQRQHLGEQLAERPLMPATNSAIVE